MVHKIVYIVAAHSRAGLNERVRKLLLLSGNFDRLVFVCAGEKTTLTDEVWEIRHTINPTGILCKLGLGGLKKAVDRWLYFPSPQVLFAKAAHSRLAKSIAKDLELGLQVSLVTCVPPHALCLLGLKLKKKFSALHWVVDWQDLWSYDAYYLYQVPWPYRNRLRRVEKQVFAACDMNVTTNPFAKRVMERYYQVPADRVTSIYHPFSDDDAREDKRGMECYARDPERRAVRLIFLGSLFKPPKVPGNKVLEAIRYVRERGIDAELHLYGNVPDDYTDELAATGVVLRGYLDSEDIIAHIRQCDFLLLVLADLSNCRTIMHAKLPQYLLAGRPLITITPEPSAVAEIVRNTGSGYVVPAGEEWGSGIYKILDEYLDGVPLPERNESVVQQFNWRNLANQWLGIL